MKTIECKSKEDAVEMLQAAKEFFHAHVDMDIAPSVITLNLSLIDAVQKFISELGNNKSHTVK
ncbi:hypothetical protein [Bacteroides clarus]|uniref:hypothetical protein n=1 Tax=Bacteroides clarus TaxID=626929 RepID=UPI00189892E9|nr:hypothetical protein [Bacteroides clarus]